MENVGREPRIPRSWMETDEDFAMECGRPHRPTPPRRPHCAGWSDDFRTRFDEADFMEDEMFVEEAVNLSAGLRLPSEASGYVRQTAAAAIMTMATVRATAAAAAAATVPTIRMTMAVRAAAAAIMTMATVRATAAAVAAATIPTIRMTMAVRAAAAAIMTMATVRATAAAVAAATILDDQDDDGRPGCGCGDHDHGNRPGDGCGCGCGNDTDDQDDDGRPGCGNHHRCPDMSLAMAYVARQRWTGKREIYSRPRALLRGTLFVELDLPFTGKGGCQDE